MDIQRLEDFPAYISCIRNYGRPILPPLLSPSEREEMVRIRHEAIIAETRIARRAIQPNLMMRIKEVIENIEKSEINLLKNDSLSLSNGGSSDLVDLSASEASLYLHMSSDMHSISVFDSHQQGDNSVTKNESDEISSVSLENKIQEVLFVSEPTDLIPERNTPCKNLIECKSSCQPECFVVDDYNYIIATSPHEQKSGYFCQESIDSCDVSERPNQSEELLVSDSSNVPQEPKTYDGDEVESESVTTVILKSQGDNHNDTDSDSAVTSLAHSTDLEKYFDSSGENGHFSESSIQTEGEKETTCIMGSVSSDVESSDTLISTDVNTPVPSHESFRAESSSDKYVRSCSSQSFTPIEDENSSKDEIKASACHKHVRRSSYTLERPSPALIQACASYNFVVNSDNLGNSVHTEFLPTDDPHLYSTNVSQTPLTNAPSKDISEIFLEAGDSIHVQPTLLESQIMENQNVSAHKVMQSFSQSPELSVSAFTPSDNSCDIIRDSSRVLLGYEPFSDSPLAPDTPTEVPIVPSQYYAIGSESDLETNGASAHTTDFYTSSQWLHSEKPPQSAETAVAYNIFQNLQELQKQKVEQFLKQQHEQWERLKMEFKDQDWLLCCQLQSLSCSHPSDAVDKVREVDDGVPTSKVSTGEKSIVEDGYAELHECPAIIVNASAVTSHHHSMKNKCQKKMPYNEDLDPSMKAKFDRVSAAVKGYLTRRLLKTDRVQGVIQTIKDTLICAVKFHEETPVKKGEITQQDAELHQRFIIQLTAACYELHDIFFKLNTKEQMMIISQSREISRERKNKIPHLPIASIKGNDAISKGYAKNKNKPMISAATIKALERKKARSLTGSGPPDRKFSNRSCMRGAQDRLHNALNHNLHIKSPSSSIFKMGRPTTPIKRNSSGKSPPKLLKSVRRLVYHKADVNSTSNVSKLDG